MIELTTQPMLLGDWPAPSTGVKHLYIHIPFCHRRCAYCDFNTYANMDDRMTAYVEALCIEIREWGVGIGSAAVSSQSLVPDPQSLTRADLRPTIFLGGGTPSMLPLPLMEQVLVAANEVIPLARAEVTVEANPGTVLGRDYLRGLRALGVNRLSMGVQSLHDPTLRMLGRIHTPRRPAPAMRTRDGPGSRISTSTSSSACRARRSSNGKRHCARSGVGGRIPSRSIR